MKLANSVLVAFVGLVVVSGCSSPTTGDEARAHAEKLGFTVTGVDGDSAVVEIGQRCHGNFTVWSLGNGDQINNVYSNNGNGEDLWGLADTEATGPDQFKAFADTAGCYK